DIDELAVGIPILIYPRPVRYLLKCFTVVKFGHCYLLSRKVLSGSREVRKESRLRSLRESLAQNPSRSSKFGSSLGLNSSYLLQSNSRVSPSSGSGKSSCV